MSGQGRIRAQGADQMPSQCSDARQDRRTPLRFVRCSRESKENLFWDAFILLAADRKEQGLKNRNCFQELTAGYVSTLPAWARRL